MAIKVTCPNGHALQLKDQCAGKTGFCPHCGARVQVPKAEQVSDDDILSIIGPAQATPVPVVPAEEVFDPDPWRERAKEKERAKGKRGEESKSSAVFRRKKVCPRCCDIVSMAFETCPQCGMSLSGWTVPVPEEKPPQAARTLCHHLGVRKQGNVTIIRFGEHQILDEQAVHKIGTEMHGVADRPECHNLLLNFAGVVGLCSAMLGNMLMLKKKMELKGAELKLCQVGAEIQEVFSATKLGQLFDVRTTEQEALKAFG
ncbi:MAG: STAS domain-containing protein [Thermoguttaceae bacterium]|jgi:anti-anti-sigma factor